MEGKYEESVKVYRDLINVVRTASQKGHKAGLEEGLEQGRAEGRAEGLEEGIRKTNIEHARKMKSLGIPSHDIDKITGLNIDDIKSLQWTSN